MAPIEITTELVFNQPPISGHFSVPDSKQAACSQLTKSVQQCLLQWTNRKPHLPFMQEFNIGRVCGSEIGKNRGMYWWETCLLALQAMDISFIYLENNHRHCFWLAILEVATYHLPTLSGSLVLRIGTAILSQHHYPPATCT